MPLESINIILAVVLIYALSNYKHVKQYRVVPVIVVILVNFISETASFTLNRLHFSRGSMWVYNFSLPIEIICYGLLFGKVFRRSKLYYLTGICYLFPFSTLYYFFIYRSIFFFISEIAIFASIYLSTITLGFFVKLYTADFYEVNPLKLFFFWLSMGVLTCYLGSYLYLSNINHLLDEAELKGMLQSINFVLNCFLYMCIVISITCLKRYPNSQIRYF